MADPDQIDTLTPESPPAPVHVPLSAPEGFYPPNEQPQTSAPPAPEGSSVGRVFSAFRQGFNASGPTSGDFSPETAARLTRWTGLVRRVRGASGAGGAAAPAYGHPFLAPPT